MDIKIVGQPTDPQAQVMADTPAVEMNQTGEIDRIAVSQMTGLETAADRQRYQEEVDAIVEWAKQENYESPTELKWIVRRLQDRLGSPPMGEKWITRIARYAKLATQARRIEDEQNRMMRGA